AVKSFVTDGHEQKRRQTERKLSVRHEAHREKATERLCGYIAPRTVPEAAKQSSRLGRTIIKMLHGIDDIRSNGPVAEGVSQRGQEVCRIHFRHFQKYGHPAGADSAVTVSHYSTESFSGVFPEPRLAFRHPRDRAGHSLNAGVRFFGPHDPIHVFALASGA